MKLNLNFKIKDLDGKDIPGAEANKLIGQVLCNLSKGNSLKLDDWGRKLWKGETLEIDDFDGKVLREIIDTTEGQISNIVKAPVLRHIDDLLKGDTKKK